MNTYRVFEALLGFFELFASVYLIFQRKKVWTMFTRFSNWYSNEENKKISEGEHLLIGVLMIGIGSVVFIFVKDGTPFSKVFGAVIVVTGFIFAYGRVEWAKMRRQMYRNAITKSSAWNKASFFILGFFVLLHSCGLFAGAFLHGRWGFV